MSSSDGRSLSELHEKGNAAFKSGLFDDAIRLYTEALFINPQEASLLSNRSAAYIKKMEFHKAVQDAEAAVAIDKMYTKAYTRLHSALCHLGRFGEAVQRLCSIITLLKNSGAPKEDVETLRRLLPDAQEGARAVETARRLLEERNFSEAERVLKETSLAFPECFLVTIMMGEARASQQPELVLRTLAPFGQTHGSDTTYLYVRALASYHLGQDGFPTAQAILRQVIGMDPDNRKASELLKKVRAIESYKAEGNTAFQKNRLNDAISSYKAAVDVDPSNVKMVAVLRGNLAAAKMKLKDFSGALLDCEFAIKNGAESAKLFARRARIQEALNNYDEALRDIQKAASMDSSYNNEVHQIKVNARSAKRKDYYKVLGLSAQEADDAAIKRAYKKGCLQWHPDKWANASDEERTHAEKMFKEVGEAFSILSDPQKKQLYDSGQLDNASGVGNEGGRFSASSEDLLNVMNMMFQGSFGGGLGPSQKFFFSNGPQFSRQPKQGFVFRF
ncbi:Tetratricopeptide repeat DnaJ domain [Trypanosoma vivax]|uniref:Putative DNAJ domain protein (Tpr repeat protein) n=1 Tax=Trypanosoma vivax (strain Y486) TaxID=1055687 RepID=G0U6E1_TRYVY|nr:TPR repeat protein [Trypanosoma vivax]KAH8611272.1 Tetratricopeptide repeat DnaJ domain [Trypanosoma vivax]CCC51445.1 TPR repeat protein [Trypanosoma vivax Y486]